ncbi:MAG: hypothetical protein U0167_15215 [bacterium]
MTLGRWSTSAKPLALWLSGVLSGVVAAVVAALVVVHLRQPHLRYREEYVVADLAHLISEPPPPDGAVQMRFVGADPVCRHTVVLKADRHVAAHDVRIAVSEVSDQDEIVVEPPSLGATVTRHAMEASRLSAPEGSYCLVTIPEVPAATDVSVQITQLLLAPGVRFTRVARIILGNGPPATSETADDGDQIRKKLDFDAVYVFKNATPVDSAAWNSASRHVTLILAPWVHPSFPSDTAGRGGAPPDASTRRVRTGDVLEGN